MRKQEPWVWVLCSLLLVASAPLLLAALMVVWGVVFGRVLGQ